MKKNLLLISLLLVAIAVIYLYNRMPSQPAPQIASPSLLSATPAPTLTPAPTPVWKIYKNQKLGFSFDYPTGSNFSMETLELETPEQLLYLHFYYGNKNKNSFVNVEVYKGDQTIVPPGPTPEFPQKVLSNYKRTYINGLSFEQYVLNGPCFPLTLQTVQNGHTYIFQDVCGPAPEFDQLIKSIKFF
jgi:hypothetical protein